MLLSWASGGLTKAVLRVMNSGLSVSNEALRIIIRYHGSIMECSICSRSRCIRESFCKPAAQSTERFNYNHYLGLSESAVKK